MKKQNTLIKDNDKNDKSERFSEFSIVGDFRVDNHQYLIIEQITDLETLIKFKSLTFYFLVLNLQIDFLKITGLTLAIILANNLANLNSGINEILTQRELQIANLVAQGHCNKQIAIQLQISEWTVATHLRRVFAKLGVDSRAAMVYRCASII
jgi:DNA-binding CsgD family transcriptional regulator